MKTVVIQGWRDYGEFYFLLFTDVFFFHKCYVFLIINMKENIFKKKTNGCLCYGKTNLWDWLRLYK